MHERQIERFVQVMPGARPVSSRHRALTARAELTRFAGLVKRTKRRHRRAGTKMAKDGAMVATQTSSKKKRRAGREGRQREGGDSQAWGADTRGASRRRQRARNRCARGSAGRRESVAKQRRRQRASMANGRPIKGTAKGQRGQKRRQCSVAEYVARSTSKLEGSGGRRGAQWTG
eukprot:6201573-Pleurochrysis_carterae.AAC.1